MKKKSCKTTVSPCFPRLLTVHILATLHVDNGIGGGGLDIVTLYRSNLNLA